MSKKTIYDLDEENPVLEWHMITHSGVLFNLKDPQGCDINLHDISVGLSRNFRWNGHTYKPYSVAEHCIRLSYKFEDTDERLYALFHDSEEAYWGNIIAPIKQVLKLECPSVVDAMLKTRRLILSVFDIVDMSHTVKPLDEKELLWEFDKMVKNPVHVPMSPIQAQEAWMTQVLNLFKKKENDKQRSKPRD